MRCFEQLTKKPPSSCQNLPQDDNAKDKLLAMPFFAQSHQFLIFLEPTLEDVEEIEKEDKSQEDDKKKP